jgi:hypothetical protein
MLRRRRIFAMKQDTNSISRNERIKDALIFFQLCVDANYNDPQILSAAAEVYEANGEKEKASDIRRRINGTVYRLGILRPTAHIMTAIFSD